MSIKCGSWRNQCGLGAIFVFAIFAGIARGAIYEWEYIDPSEPSRGKRESARFVPDGQYLNAVPGAYLSGADLTKAYLIGKDLTRATLWSLLRDADLTDAIVQGASLSKATARGFVAEQLYSTASYRARDLREMDLNSNDLSGWNFAQQDLGKSNLGGTLLLGSNLREANLTSVNFYGASLAGADFTDANVQWADFYATTAGGFTAEQLYSTASYRSGDLTGIRLRGVENDFSGWNFAGRNLTSANFRDAAFNNANFSQANLTNADFLDTKMAAASFHQAILVDAEFRRTLLSGADFSEANLRDTDFGGAALDGASFTGAHVAGASFSGTTYSGFTAEQLYSTASYQSRDLKAVSLSGGVFEGWNFAEQNLTSAGFSSSDLTDCDFQHGQLSGAGFNNAQLVRVKFDNSNLSGASFRSAEFSDVSFRGAYLRNANFDNAALWRADLTDADVQGITMPGGMTAAQLYSTASYKARNLHGIVCDARDLRDWDFTGQDLTGANFDFAKLTGASFHGAIVRGARLGTSSFSADQLYSTASYQSRDLRGISLLNLYSNLSGWSFANQDLTDANLMLSTLVGANFRDSTLTDTLFPQATLSGADFAGAKVHGTDFSRSTGFTPAQLYSTASYQAREIPRIQLASLDLRGWVFAGIDLTGSSFHDAILAGTDFTGAHVEGVDLGYTTRHGFTVEQLYSTASYRAGDLQGIALDRNDLRGAKFAGQKLVNSDFTESTLTGADFQGASLRDAVFEEAELSNANFRGSDLRNADFFRAKLDGVDFSDSRVEGTGFGSVTRNGFTAAQLYSTASYKAQELSGIFLRNNNLAGWNFSHQDLTNSNLSDSSLTDADFTGADIRGVRHLDSETEHVTNLIGRDGVIVGLNLTQGRKLVVRDYDGNPAAGTGLLPLHVEDFFSADESGRLRLLMDSDNWDSTISFAEGISVTLGGQLELVFRQGVDVGGHIGRSIQLFDWRGVTPLGTFTISSPYMWDVSRLYSDGTVALIAVPEPQGLAMLFTALAVWPGAVRWVPRRVEA